MAASRLDRLRDWVALFLMGTINNLPYVVVNSSAKILASSFHKDNLVPLVMFSNVAFGLFGGSLSTALTLVKVVPFWVRFLGNGLLMLGGLILVAFTPNFWIALIGIVMCGLSSTFGENTTLGYLHMRQKSLISAWSSGTGFAGVAGATLYILLTCVAADTVEEGQETTSKLKGMNKFAFLATVPVVLIYWLAYFVILTKGETPQLVSEQASEDERSLLHSQPPNYQAIAEKPHSIQGCEGGDSVTSEAVSSEVVIVVQQERCGSVRRVLRCLCLIWWLALNLGAVYLFEYMARGAASKARPKSEYGLTSCPELFASLQLCYQAGVFVSRSSLGLVKIRRVEVLSVLQFINMVVWVLLPLVSGSHQRMGHGGMPRCHSFHCSGTSSLPIFYQVTWYMLGSLEVRPM
jgi:battenin